MKQQPTKVTPGYNVMWESSRMIIPQHKEALLNYGRTREARERPQLDNQEFEEIGRIIQQAAETGRLIRLTIFDPIQDVVVIGQVQMIDPYEQRIRLAHDGKKTWVTFGDVMSVEII